MLPVVHEINEMGNGMGNGIYDHDGIKASLR